MYFASKGHAETYKVLASKAQAGRDCELTSPIYVLAAIEKNLSSYIETETIRFSKLMKAAAPWSSGEKALLLLAATLFNSFAWPVPIADVFENLDETNTKVALEALRIRYQGA